MMLLEALEVHQDRNRLKEAISGDEEKDYLAKKDYLQRFLGTIKANNSGRYSNGDQTEVSYHPISLGRQTLSGSKDAAFEVSVVPYVMVRDNDMGTDYREVGVGIRLWGWSIDPKSGKKDRLPDDLGEYSFRYENQPTRGGYESLIELHELVGDIYDRALAAQIGSRSR